MTAGVISALLLAVSIPAEAQSRSPEYFASLKEEAKILTTKTRQRLLEDPTVREALAPHSNMIEANLTKIESALDRAPVSPDLPTGHCLGDQMGSSRIVEAYFQPGELPSIYFCPAALARPRRQQLTILVHEMAHFIGELSEENATLTEMAVALTTDTALTWSGYYREYPRVQEALRALAAVVFRDRAALPARSSNQPAAQTQVTAELSPTLLEMMTSLKKPPSRNELVILPNRNNDELSFVEYCSVERERRPSGTRELAKPDGRSYTFFARPSSMPSSVYIELQYKGGYFGIYCTNRHQVPIYLDDFKRILATGEVSRLVNEYKSWR